MANQFKLFFASSNSDLSTIYPGQPVTYYSTLLNSTTNPSICKTSTYNWTGTTSATAVPVTIVGFIPTMARSGAENNSEYWVPSYKYSYGDFKLSIYGISATTMPKIGNSFNVTYNTDYTVSPLGWEKMGVLNMNKFMSASTLIPNVKYYSFSLGSTGNSTQNYNYGAKWVETTEATVTPSWIPAPYTYFKSYVFSKFDDNTYYDGIRYVLYNKSSTDGVCIAEDWSYNDNMTMISTSTYCSYFTLTDSYLLTDTSYVAVVPFSYTRFKYPDLSDEYIKIVNTSSYFIDENGVWKQNAYIDLQNTDTSKSGTTEILRSMQDSCLLYGSQSYLNVYISSLNTDENMAPLHKYISSIQVTAYKNNGESLIGTQTFRNIYSTQNKYNFIQKTNAYTFTLNVTTRMPNITIANSSSSIAGNTDMIFNFSGDVGSGINIIGNNSSTGSSTFVTKTGDLIISSIIVPDDKANLKVSEYTVTTYDSTGKNKLSKTYTNTGSAQIIATNPCFDVDIVTKVEANDKINCEIYQTSPLIGGNSLDYTLSYKTCTYTGSIQYSKAQSTGSYYFETYITSLTLTDLTINPNVEKFAYIDRIDTYRLHQETSSMSKITKWKTINDIHSDNVILDVNSGFDYIKDSLIIQVCASSYNYPISAIEETNGRQYTISINNSTAYSVTSGSKVSVLKGITYSDTISVNYIKPTDTAYELNYFNIVGYKYNNTYHTGNTTEPVVTCAEKLSAGVDYTLRSDIIQTYLSPYYEYAIQPVFKLTEAPLPVVITAKVAANPYNISLFNKSNDTITNVDVEIATMECTDYVSISKLDTTYRYTYIDNENSKITYTNTSGDVITSNGINVGDSIRKPDSLSGTLKSVDITPVVNTYLTYNIYFDTTTSGSTYYFKAEWSDTSDSGYTYSKVERTLMDYMVPIGYSFTLSSVTSNDSSIEVNSVNVINGSTTTVETLPFNITSASGGVNSDIVISPIVTSVIKNLYIKLKPFAEANYILKYTVNGAENTVIVNKDSTIYIPTDNFLSTDSIIFTSIEFINNTEYSLDSFSIDGTIYELNKSYTFNDCNIGYVILEVTPKYDPSKIDYKLNINTEKWSDKFTNDFKYKLFLSDINFKFRKETLNPSITKPPVEEIKDEYVIIDSSKYKNLNTLNLEVTYTGSGTPSSKPTTYIMPDTDNINYYVVSGYNPYQVAYNTIYDDYSWSAPVTNMFDLNIQKKIQYIMQVSASKYAFRGTLVPYDTESKVETSISTVSFSVLPGNSSTYILPSPESVNIDKDNYGIMVANTAIETESGTWTKCKYKLSLTPTVVPTENTYVNLTIYNGDNHTEWDSDKQAYATSIYKISVLRDNTTVLNDFLLSSYMTGINVPYFATNNKDSVIKLTISLANMYGDSYNYKIAYENSGSALATASPETGILTKEFIITAGTTMKPSLYINYPVS